MTGPEGTKPSRTQGWCREGAAWGDLEEAPQKTTSLTTSEKPEKRRTTATWRKCTGHQRGGCELGAAGTGKDALQEQEAWALQSTEEKSNYEEEKDRHLSLA